MGFSHLGVVDCRQMASSSSSLSLLADEQKYTQRCNCRYNVWPQGDNEWTFRSSSQLPPFSRSEEIFRISHTMS